MNNAPDFIKGTFAWRLVLADEPNALEEARASIATVSNLLDGTVKQIVFIAGCLGLDDAFPNWDGAWPYLGIPSYRINRDWKYLSDFMIEMRDRYHAAISLHVNLTDVNVGLAYTPITRDFFARMREAKCIYTRDGGACGEPYRGLAFVPQTIPIDTAKMPYVNAGDAADIFAIVDYKRFWESGLAKESINSLYDNLPYAPPVIYWDVLSATGNNLCVGFPDGLLGGSLQTQTDGRAQMMSYLNDLGSVVGAEGPSDFAPYGWAHGGLATNDYARINTGYGHGAGQAHGCKSMQVYGNQGGYHHQAPPRNPDSPRPPEPAHLTQVAIENDDGVVMVTPVATQAQDNVRKLPYPLRGAEVDGTFEVGTAEDMATNFYLTVIQELYHIGKGNIRMPGGDTATRLDEIEGRVELQSFAIMDPSTGFERLVEASETQLIGSSRLRSEPVNAIGPLVSGINLQFGNGCKFDVAVPKAGPYELLIRYVSSSGGTIGLSVNDSPITSIRLPAGGTDTVRLADFATTIDLQLENNTIQFTKPAIYAAWSDGTTARWNEDGFHAGGGDVTFGIGYDRMWPDTWSGEKKIYFYSKTGTARTWTLPEDWSAVTVASLYSLTKQGRSDSLRVEIANGAISAALPPGTPCVLTIP